MHQSMVSQPAWQMANWTTLSQSCILMGEFPLIATRSEKVLLSFYQTARDFFLVLNIKARERERVAHIASNGPTMCFYCTQPFGWDEQDWPVPSGEYHFCEGLKQLRQHEGCKLPGDQSKSAHLVWMEKTLSTMRRITKSLSVMDLDHLHLDGKLSGEWMASSLPVAAR